jgi:hypothetical protein
MKSLQDSHRELLRFLETQKWKKKKKVKAPDSASSKLGSEREREREMTYLPPTTKKEPQGQGRRLLPTPYPPCQTSGTLSKDTQTDKKEKAENRMDPPPLATKE